jgi:acetylglutamate kinase
MTIVLKYGGNAMPASSSEDPLLDDIVARVREGDRVVLVHGGGPKIDEALAARGMKTERIDGLRVTDAASLEVIESVLCGTVNKALVRALTHRGLVAVGISGEDGGLLIAREVAASGGRSIGYVGEIVSVAPRVLAALLDIGATPVVAPLAVAADASTAYNVNADTAAGAIAGALAADAYVVVTNVDRVRRRLDDESSGIAEIGADEARALVADGTFGGGMKPKIESALDALARGAKSAVICGSGPGALGRALDGSSGTRIVP